MQINFQRKQFFLVYSYFHICLLETDVRETFTKHKHVQHNANYIYVC